MVLNLEEMGFEVEASHHEVAPAQHEIDFKYGEALETADKIMTYKLTVKTIAKRHGLYASFMPKPNTECAVQENENINQYMAEPLVYVCDCYQKINVVTGMPKSNFGDSFWL